MGRAHPGRRLRLLDRKAIGVGIGIGVAIADVIGTDSDCDTDSDPDAGNAKCAFSTFALIYVRTYNFDPALSASLVEC
jgi:hypothetical protein